jgi:hypothetical protein
MKAAATLTEDFVRGIKGQDQFRQGVRVHLWALDLNILGDELL